MRVSKSQLVRMASDKRAAADAEYTKWRESQPVEVTPQIDASKLPADWRDQIGVDVANSDSLLDAFAALAGCTADDILEAYYA